MNPLRERRKWLVLAATALSIALISGQRAGAAGFDFPPAVSEDGLLEIEVKGFYQNLPPFGYAPVRIISRNGRNSPARLSFMSTSSARYGRDQSSASFAQTMEVPAGGGSAELLLPLQPDGGGRSFWGALNVNLSGAGISERFSQGFNHAGGPTLVFVALDESLGNILLSEVQSKLDAPHKSGLQQTVRVDFRNGPVVWTGLGGVDQVWITERMFGRIEGDRRAALRDWVLRGGKLFLTESASEGTSRAGLGQLTRLASIDAAALVKAIQGHGRSLGNTLANSYQGGDFDLQKPAGEIALNWGLLVLLMFALVIVAGPVNLFLLAGGRNRHRLFLTTPLISLGAGVIFLILIVAQDGIGGALWRQTLLVLVPEENREVVITEQASRTGILLNGAFRREPDTMILPLRLDVKSSENRLSISGKADGTVSGWFQSRTVSGLNLQRVRPSRARIEILDNDASRPVNATARLRVASTLGIDLHNLHLVLDDGSRWRAATLPAGGRAELEPVAADAFDSAQRGFLSRLGPWPRSLVADDFLKRPGTFFATADEGAGQTAIPTIHLRVAEDRASVCGTIYGQFEPIR